MKILEINSVCFRPLFDQNHHDASIFEKIELYVSHAVHVIADPQLYVRYDSFSLSESLYNRCVDSFKQFAQVVKSLPEHLEDQISSAVDKVKDADLHEHKVCSITVNPTF